MADEESNQQESNDEETPLIKQMRKELAEAKKSAAEAESRAAKAEMRSTFVSMGIDTNKGVGRLFYENYNGDVSEDAIRAAAEEYDLPLFNTPEAPATQENQKVEAAHKAVQQATSSGSPERPPSIQEIGLNAFQEALNTTGSRDKAMAAGFDAKLQAAIEQARGA